MNTDQSMNADQWNGVLLRANMWGYNFLLFALLTDIMYRSAVLRKAPWDLFALLGVSGVISMVYAARHKVNIFGWKIGVVMAVVALVAAIVAAILAMTKAM